MAENPLLTDPDTPNHAPRFSDIRDEHFMPAIEAAIEEGRENIDSIKNNPGPANFENTIVALETATETLNGVARVFYNLLSAAGTDELQAMAEEIGPITARFGNEILHDEILLERVKAVHEKQDTLNLTPEQMMLLDETYKGFVRGGALLGEDAKARYREITERLSILGPTFMNNVKKSTEQFSLVLETEADLAGLPEGIREAAADTAKELGHEGKWVFTLDAPSFMPFVKFSGHRDYREKMWRAYTSRAWQDDYDNSSLILEILNLRHEKAQLLGYKNHAAYVLEDRMAERPETVIDFLDTLKKTYKPAAEDDLERLRTFAGETDGLDEIQPWDVAYYAEKLRQKLFDFSSEDFRPYFPLENVLDGVFEHFSKLFHLRFKHNPEYPVWHEDVKGYDVFDLTDGAFVGTLYTDFYPRKGKKTGAWKTAFRNQGLFRGKIERPVISIVCNFTKPSGKKPSLLTHGEVSTLFHEMGHAIHALLSRVTYQSVAGTSVLWDFVELPSQIQENWAYSKETLDLFARHYETGKTIPEELVDKLNKAKNFMTGWGGLRQMGLATLDMAWHTVEKPDEIKDVAEFEDAALADTSLFPRLSGPISTAFNHIFAGGYSAGYYSYKWAEVLDADAFELFQDRGLYDAPTAEAFKNEVLAKGGSEHPTVLYRRFRGRDADPDALLRREGLLKAGDKAA